MKIKQITHVLDSLIFFFFIVTTKSILMTLISFIDGGVRERVGIGEGLMMSPDFIVFDTSLIIYSVYFPPLRWTRRVIVVIWMMGHSSRGTLAGMPRLRPSKFSIVSLYTPPSLSPLKFCHHCRYNP